MTDADLTPAEPVLEPEAPAGPDPASESGVEAESEAESGALAEPDPGTQAELDLGLVSTGDLRVDAALAGLAILPTLPVAEHPGVFDDVHRGLHVALTELDED